MATYQEIQADVRNQHGRTVKTCWIAHVKELNGLPLRKTPNRAAGNVRQVLCPADIRPIIEESMRRLGMLK